MVLERNFIAVRLGFQKPEIIIERELDVHIHLQPPRQYECVIGPRRARLDHLLFMVVNAVLEPDKTQNVLGHPFSPLAALFRIREGFPELVRSALELGRPLGRDLQLCRELSVLLLPVLFKADHLTLHAGELLLNRRQSLIYQAFLVLELLLSQFRLLGKRFPGELQKLLCVSRERVI